MPAIIKAHAGFVPELGEAVFIADGAIVVGHVELQTSVTVWYGAVIRGDSGLIRIGAFSTIQDLACLHRKKGGPALEIGEYVSVGHGAVIHGAKIGDGVYVGHGSIVMDGADIGEDSILTAGCLVPRGMVVPPRSFVRGRPAQVVRELSPDEIGAGRREAERQIEIAKEVG